MGFKRWTQTTNGRKGHSWSNHPDYDHKICTTCGILRVHKVVNSVNILEYHLNDGSITTECPECKSKSLYELLIEE